MGNVYFHIDKYYEKQSQAETIFPKTMAERFFRERAWKGEKEAEQIKKWLLLSELVEYIALNEFDSFYSLNALDVQEIIFRFGEKNNDVLLNEDSINDIFSFLYDFALWYEKKSAEDNFLYFTFSTAQKAFFPLGKFTLPDRKDVAELAAGFDELFETESPEQLNKLWDYLVARMGLFFQMPEYHNDLARAVTQYVGPVIAQDDVDASFWLAFWDYFFFDYHLIDDDSTPVVKYYNERRKYLEPDEKQLLLSMIDTKFTVFSVDGIYDDVVLCIDLLTDTPFEMPYPDGGIIGDYTKFVFFGHMQFDDVFMLNYVTVFPASELLRNRMKTEILRLYEIYKKYQQPEATIEYFVSRQTAVIRHTLFILSNFNRLKVVNENIVMPPVTHSELRHIEPELKLAFSELTAELNFTQDNRSRAMKLYTDFIKAQGEDYIIDDNMLMVAAVLWLIIDLNGIEYLYNFVGALRKRKIKKADVVDLAKEIMTVLQCREYDPRYLTEEGFVQMVYKD